LKNCQPPSFVEVLQEGKSDTLRVTFAPLTVVPPRSKATEIVPVEDAAMLASLTAMPSISTAPGTNVDEWT
jgi:hypothetical protein